MAASIQVFKHKSIEEPEAVVQYLETLIQGIRNGELKLGTGADELDLRPSSPMRLLVRSRRNKKGKEGVGFRITWNRPASTEAASKPLQIQAPQKHDGKGKARTQRRAAKK